MGKAYQEVEDAQQPVIRPSYDLVFLRKYTKGITNILHTYISTSNTLYGQIKEYSVIKY